MAKIMMEDKDRGFTLIELMIVIAIIGILAAIAIPQFNAYRHRGYNATAVSDLRNALGAQESYYVDHKTYAPVVNLLTTVSYSLNTSENVELTTSGATSAYTIISYHDAGTKTYTLIGPGGQITSE